MQKLNAMHQANPFILIILDGFGYREARQYNAIAQANTPFWDRLWENYPHMLLEGSGSKVGLPDGQMGNSEVGHLNLGAGRIVRQEFSRIQHSIEEGNFLHNETFIKAIDNAIKNHKKIHVLGLLSDGGVHSHQDHIFALIKMAAERGSQDICLHAFLDGRDTAPKCAKASLLKAEKLFTELSCGKIASLTGRYYAMDRDKRWERTEKAYRLLCEAKTEFHYASALEALNAAYQRGETDEFVQASSIHAQNSPATTIEDGDCVIFMNYRADRARQLSQAFCCQSFSGFDVKNAPKLANFVSLTQYATDIPTEVAFAPVHPQNTLGECVAKHNLRQLRIAETEKYAHVTFFFNGGREQAFVGEERELIPSPKVATYDSQPEMNAPLLTKKLVAAIASESFGFIVCNYANPDMIGHTGNFSATVQAIECIDDCLKQVVTAVEKVNGQAIITADHGNAEYMFNQKTQQAHTAHTSEPVPLVYVGQKNHYHLAEHGALCDIAPTILHLMNLPIPMEMSHNILISHEEKIY